MSETTTKNQAGELVVSNILTNRIMKYAEDHRMSNDGVKEKLAAHLGINKLNITRWMRNNAQPSLAEAIEISKFLGLPVEQVFITHK